MRAKEKHNSMSYRWLVLVGAIFVAGCTSPIQTTDRGPEDTVIDFVDAVRQDGNTSRYVHAAVGTVTWDRNVTVRSARTITERQYVDREADRIDEQKIQKYVQRVKDQLRGVENNTGTNTSSIVEVTWQNQDGSDRTHFVLVKDGTWQLISFLVPANDPLPHDYGAPTEPLEPEVSLFGLRCYNQDQTAHMKIFIENTGEAEISTHQTTVIVHDEVEGSRVMNQTVDLSTTGRSGDPNVDTVDLTEEIDRSFNEPGQLAAYLLEFPGNTFEMNHSYTIGFSWFEQDQNVYETETTCEGSDDR